jgi:hypothetical protein
MSESAIHALMPESIHKYVNVDVQRGVVSQRLIMKSDFNREVGVKELMTDYVIKAMDPERKVRLYEALHIITQ